MLSVDKLNKNRARVNQHNTERGILKDKQKEIIEAVALTLAPKEYTTEEKTIDEQLATMKREKNEKKLLEYQLKNNPQTVSTFLANKYADGNFNQAVKDRYDNSEARKKSGLTFDYHVFLPKEVRYNDKRGHNQYILTEPILDRTTGDSYTYHIPMYINSDGIAPYFITDYGEIVDDPNSQGLKWALRQLRIAIDSGKFILDSLSEEILTQFGFLVDGKIVHAITGDIFVEKYLKTISPPEKRADAIAYLDSFANQTPKDMLDILDIELKTLDGKKEEHDITDALPDPKGNTVGNDDPFADLVADLGVAPTGTPAADLGADLGADLVEDTETDTDTTPATPAVAGKTVTIKPGEYAKKTVSEVAKDNGIPVIEYKQMKKGNNPPTVEWLEVFLGDTVYKLGFRTGFVGGQLWTFRRSMGIYHNEVLSDVKNGKLTVAPFDKDLKALLTNKGFTEILDGKAPSLLITNFDRSKTV